MLDQTQANLTQRILEKLDSVDLGVSGHLIYGQRRGDTKAFWSFSKFDQSRVPREIPKQPEALYTFKEFVQGGWKKCFSFFPLLFVNPYMLVWLFYSSRNSALHSWERLPSLLSVLVHWGEVAWPWQQTLGEEAHHSGGEKTQTQCVRPESTISVWQNFFYSARNYQIWVIRAPELPTQGSCSWHHFSKGNLVSVLINSLERTKAVTADFSDVAHMHFTCHCSSFFGGFPRLVSSSLLQPWSCNCMCSLLFLSQVVLTSIELLKDMAVEGGASSLQSVDLQMSLEEMMEMYWRASLRPNKFIVSSLWDLWS